MQFSFLCSMRRKDKNQAFLCLIKAHQSKKYISLKCISRFTISIPEMTSLQNQTERKCIFKQSVETLKTLASVISGMFSFWRRKFFDVFCSRVGRALVKLSFEQTEQFSFGSRFFSIVLGNNL